MLIETLREYYAYTDWANDRVLTAAEALTPQQFLESDLPGISSIRDTLVHIQWANWVWLGRWKPDPGRADFDKLEFPDIASIRAFGEQMSSDLHAMLEQLDDEQVGRQAAYTNHLNEKHEFSLGLQVLHLANHATYHRGEVAALLTRFGCSPGEIDITRWMARKDERRSS
ncbi:MAG: DinB family protein [Thermomicrobiales bacterium]